MPDFASFLDILPDPDHKIGVFGQPDVTGYGGGGFVGVTLTSSQPMIRSKTAAKRIDIDAEYHHLWELSIRYNPMTCAEFQPVFSFLAHKRATLLPFYVSLPQYSTQAVADKATSGDKIKRDTTLLITDVGVLPGMLFKTNTHTKVYMVTRVEDETNYFSPEGSPGAGYERLHFSPALQADVVGGATLSFTDPTFKVVQSGEILQYSIGTDNLYTFTLKVVEADT